MTSQIKLEELKLELKHELHGDEPLPAYRVSELMTLMLVLVERLLERDE